MKKSKKAQGEIIGAVILILIVVTISIIVLTFVVPFVRERLAGTGCFDLSGQISFSDNTKYTCYKENPGADSEVSLQIHVGDVKDFEGFIIELGGATSKSIEIKEGVTISDPEVKMFSGATTLKLPGKNEERTYTIKHEPPDYVRLYPILKGGKTCDVSDTISKLEICTA